MKAIIVAGLFGIISFFALGGCNSGTSEPSLSVANLSASPIAAPAPSTSPSASTPPSVITAHSQIDQVSFHSAALGSEMNLSVYLPPGYSEDVRYPVLYMLYGYGGNHDSWFTYLNINTVADQLIQEDRIHPVIIVSPDYGNSFGVNTKVGEGHDPGGVSIGPYEDYLIQDVISYVDGHYSTQASKEARYVGGASMGGYAALYLGFKHPELFSKIGAHSAAIWTYTPTDEFTDQRDWLYAAGMRRDERDPFKLASADKLKGMKVYLDAGEDDALAEKDKSLYDLLLTMNVDAKWVLSPGGHTVSYWSGQLSNYMLFYAGKE
ncbi:alpha/beta hydrolase [Cohnella yongneupensis]|uniref:Alpha/beta hydrolase n=1 Tax=Cohnella yongneupensis TaxID=425006 RepID=A0ABW0QX31_9BACL